jgi:hypothetical protein
MKSCSNIIINWIIFFEGETAANMATNEYQPAQIKEKSEEIKE